MKKILIAVLAAAVCAGAWGAPKAKAKTSGKVASPVRRAPYQGAISVEAATGRVLFEDRADEKCCPASVTKLMTCLLVLEDLHAFKYAQTDEVTATQRCAREKPSVCGLKPGTRVTVDELLYAMLVHSANDAAVLLAEHSVARNAGREPEAGDLAAFIARMNAKAKELGMTRTTYVTANGYPPPHGSGKPYDESTARDLVKLGRAVLKYPEIYRWTNVKTYTMKTLTTNEGTPLKIMNHNRVLRMDKYQIRDAQGRSEVDGLKTGYADYGGSSVVLTGARGGKRALVIVAGSETSKLRDENARRLMVEALDALAK